MVFRGSIQFRFLPTTAARAAFGRRLNDIATAAFRAIARTDKGLKLAHLQFRHGQDLVAVCSRVRKDGELEIEIDVGNEQLPAVVFSDDEMKGANRHQDRQTRDKTRLYHGTIFHTSSLPGAARPVLRRAVAPSRVPPVWDQGERVSAARSRRRRRTEKLAGSPDILCAQAVGANPEKATKTDASEPSSLSHPCPCCGRRSSSSRLSSVSTRPDIDRRSIIRTDTS